MLEVLLSQHERQRGCKVSCACASTALTSNSIAFEIATDVTLSLNEFVGFTDSSEYKFDPAQAQRQDAAHGEVY